MRIIETTSLEDTDVHKRRFLGMETDNLYEFRDQLPVLHSQEPELFPGLSVYSITIQATKHHCWEAELEYR